jgi:hypothetical protein
MENRKFQEFATDGAAVTGRDGPNGRAALFATGFEEKKARPKPRFEDFLTP